MLKNIQGNRKNTLKWEESNFLHLEFSLLCDSMYILYFIEVLSLTQGD